MTVTPGRRETNRLRTWNRIRTAALDLFLERGFESVSIDDIAAAAAVSRATFFNYFATKEGVVFDPDPREAEHLLELWEARGPGEAIWTTVQGFVTDHVHSLGDRVTVTRELIDRSPTLAASGRTLGDRLRPRLAAWLAERHPDTDELDIAVLVDIALAATLTAFRLWQPEQGRARYHELLRRSLVLIAGIDTTPVCPVTAGVSRV